MEPPQIAHRPLTLNELVACSRGMRAMPRFGNSSKRAITRRLTGVSNGVASLTTHRVRVLQR
jgi:hypothetical protein